MIRGIEGRKIFQNDQDRLDFISRLAQLVETTGIRILAWVLMSNHAHLLVVSGTKGISLFMRRLLTGYAINYNRRHGRIGHLFQNRYKSVVCDEEPYLLELVRYIHLNPVRAKEVKSLAELEQYSWGGHSVLVGRRKNKWQERGYVLKYFSDREKTAIRAYRRFIEEGKDQGRRPELVGGGLVRSLGGWSQVLSLRRKKETLEHDARILGGEDFVRDILREADRGLRRQLRLGERREFIERWIKKISREEGVGEEELRMGGGRRQVSRARARISYHLSHELGIPMAEIARELGVCTSAIAKAIQKWGAGGEK